MERVVGNDMEYAWVATALGPVVVTGADGGVLALNSAFERLFAISQSRLPSEPLEELIVASRFRSAYRAARRVALTAGRSPTPGQMSELAAVRADGGEFPVQLSMARTSEDPLEVATWIRDLSANQTLVTQTLRRAALLERAEELAGFGSWQWQPDRGRVLWSDNMFRIHGLRPGEIEPSIGYAIAHCHPGDRARVQRAADELHRGGGLPQLRYRYVWPEGTVRHLRLTVVSVAESEGRPRRMSGTVQDVTDQHQAELEIAARFAASDALSTWQPGVAGAVRLLSALAEALEFDAGVMWVPRGHALAPWAIWQARALYSPTRESALRELRLARGVGLAGSAWASAAPMRITELTDAAAETVRALDAQTGLHETLALPAQDGDEVLAVLTFACEQPTLPSERFKTSLVGIGHEIGRFLSHRRGELFLPALTPREVEVMQLSATGHPRRRIAEQLEITEATVKTHLEHIYRKLGVPDRASAVAEALRQGLID